MSSYGPQICPSPTSNRPVLLLELDEVSMLFSLECFIVDYLHIILLLICRHKKKDNILTLFGDVVAENVDSSLKQLVKIIFEQYNPIAHKAEALFAGRIPKY